MSISVIATSDNKAAKLWAKTVFRDTLSKMWYGKLIGKGANSCIQIMPETKKSRGDKVTIPLRMQLSGAGRTGQQVLIDNEEDMTFYDDALYIDLQRHATKFDTTITQQRVEYEYRTEAKDALSDWWAQKFDKSLFQALAGDTSFTFAGNTASSADTGHAVYASTNTAESTMTTAHVFTLSMIDKAVYKAKTGSNGTYPIVRPLNVEGESYYMAILHPNCVYDLRTSTSTGGWLDIQKAAAQGGKLKDNPIFTGALGIYNGVILYESNNVHSGAYGSSSATVYRNLLLGAQAGVIAFGNLYGLDQMIWAEELKDYGKDLGISASCIWGIKKTRFNSLDYGVITMSSGGTSL